MIVKEIEKAREVVKDCIDLWIQTEQIIISMERELKHWPNAAHLKKTVS